MHNDLTPAVRQLGTDPIPAWVDVAALVAFALFAWLWF